ncbi:glycosyltransferase [Ruegeria sediminis]|uniref:Glycosyltransferase n=1 Tax=Ruegeria sediminis TaxID=2583820 RepID=A0ABY2X1H5_9RHOB|nr:glycosyltransferase [Ruegeria sediminis]TMV09060.1 glycosyltransferase [Ruegeria sediminis]
MTEIACPVLVSYEITEGTGDLYLATVSLIALQRLLGNELSKIEVVIPDPAVAHDARANWSLAKEMEISIVEIPSLGVDDISPEGGFLIRGAPIVLACQELTIEHSFTISDGSRRAVCITRGQESPETPPPADIFPLQARLGASSQPDRHVFPDINDAVFAELRETIRRHHRNGYFWDYRYRSNPQLGSGVGSRGIYQTIKREVLNRYVVAHNLSVVDLGCGDLEVCRFLSFRSYLGVDEAPQALEIARQKRPDWSFQLAPVDASAGPVADAAICFEVLIHAPSQKAAKALIDTLVSCASQRIVVSGYDHPVPKSSIIYFHEPLHNMLERIPGWNAPVLVTRYENLSVYVMDRENANLPHPEPFDDTDTHPFTWDALTKLERSMNEIRAQISQQFSAQSQQKCPEEGRLIAAPPIVGNEPIVSVIVAFRNERERIGRFLRTLSEQNEPSFEVHLVDDGSDDESGEIVSDFARKDSRFILWDNTDSRGPSARRNQGMEASNGKFLLFADADDELTPDALQYLLDLSLRNRSEVVRGSHMFCFENGDSSPNTFDQYHQPDINGVTYAAMPSLVFLYTSWNMLIDRKYLEETGIRFDETLLLGEDRLFNQQLFAASRSISLTKKITYRWIRDRTSTRHLSYSRSSDARINSIHAFLSLMFKLPEAGARHRELAQAAMFWEIYHDFLKTGSPAELTHDSGVRLGHIVDMLDFPDCLLQDPSVKGWSREEMSNARSAYLRMRRTRTFE